MLRNYKNWARRKIKAYILKSFPELQYVESPGMSLVISNFINSVKGKHTSIYAPSHISDSNIGDYTYISQNCYISNTVIGKFCSIGPNILCGWGIHPTYTISTHPMFYSTEKQNGMTLSSTNKIEERKPINIGNDVFIGANTTILDGVTIGDGAVIGAGAVVSKDIPPYAIAVGCPIKILRYRFDEKTRDKLLRLKWWDFDEQCLYDVEQMFFDVDGFVKKYSNNQ